jgi:hypothetical protein
LLIVREIKRRGLENMRYRKIGKKNRKMNKRICVITWNLFL